MSPRTKTKDPERKPVNVYLTRAEHDAIKRAAKREGLPPATYLRTAALARAQFDPERRPLDPGAAVADLFDAKGAHHGK